MITISRAKIAKWVLIFPPLFIALYFGLLRFLAVLALIFAAPYVDVATRLATAPRLWDSATGKFTFSFFLSIQGFRRHFFHSVNVLNQINLSTEIQGKAHIFLPNFFEMFNTIIQGKSIIIPNAPNLKANIMFALASLSSENSNNGKFKELSQQLDTYTVLQVKGDAVELDVDALIGLINQQFRKFSNNESLSIIVEFLSLGGFLIILEDKPQKQSTLTSSSHIVEFIEIFGQGNVILLISDRQIVAPCLQPVSKIEFQHT